MRADKKNPVPTTCCLQETDCKYKDLDRLKVKGQNKIYHANTNQKKTGLATLISDKVDFRARESYQG